MPSTSQPSAMTLFAPDPCKSASLLPRRRCVYSPGLWIPPLHLCRTGVLKLEWALDSLEGLWKLRLLGPKPRVSDSVGLRWRLIIYFSNKFLGDDATAGARPDFEKHYSRACFIDFPLLPLIREPLPPHCFFSYAYKGVQIYLILKYRQKSPLTTSRMGVAYFSILPSTSKLLRECSPGTTFFLPA